MSNWENSNLKDIPYHNSYKQFFEKQYEEKYFTELEEFINHKFQNYNNRKVNIYPPKELVFNAFNLVPIDKIKVVLPQVLKEQREAIITRLTDIDIDYDENRLEQEMVLLTNKMDISEELERIGTHVNEVRRILTTDGAVGRRLDFLMQELNREANTAGSKSTNDIVSYASVELKVLIEQMREQIQNIE